MNQDQSWKYYTPDARSLFLLVRAWNIKNELEEYHQPCTYLLSALLFITNSTDLAYHMMQRIWHCLCLKMHFTDDFSHSNRVMRTIRIQIELIMPRLAEKLDEMDLFDKIIQSFYCLILQNFGFTG